MRSKSVKEWLSSMKSHTCTSKSLMSEDEPEHLTVRCVCSCGEEFSIGMISLKETEDELNGEDKVLFSELLETRKNKEALAKNLDRILN